MVTTVAELSNEMSESLSLASTYGMSFDNVATAFAKMTKAGTSTNEAGTAIARMMEELGSSSSKVSEILKEKTGKSFTELCENGESLYDILGIIQQYADETGVSMGDLWSSSNAGVGALQILNAEGGTFNDMLKEISSSSGLLDESFSKMADTSEFKLASAINNLKNSLIDIGGALAPVIDGISSAISGVANWVSGLGGGFKTAIGYISGLIAVISPLLGIGAKVIGGLGNIWESMLGAGSLSRALESKGIKNIFTKAMGEIGEEGGKALANSVIGKETTEALKKLSKSETPKFTIETNLDKVNDSASKSSGIFTKLFGIIKAHPYATLATAIGLATVALVKYKKKQEETARTEAYENSKKKVQQVKEEIEANEQNIKTIEGIAERYDYLANKTNRTKKETEEYYSLCEQIGAIFPELLKYDENGNPFLDLKDGAKGLVEELKEANRQKKLLYVQETKDNAVNALNTKQDVDKTTDDSLRKLSNDRALIYAEMKENQDYFWDKDKETKKQIVEENKKLADEIAQTEQEIVVAKQNAVNQQQGISDSVKTWIDTQIQASEDYVNASDKVKESADGLIDSLDFSQIKTERLETVQTALQELYKTDEEGAKVLQESSDKINKLNNDWHNGSISQGEYVKGQKEITATLKETFPILKSLTDTEIAQMISSPEFNVDMANETVDEILQFGGSVREALMSISTIDDQETRINQAITLANSGECSEEVRSQILKAIEDGNITDEELETIFNLVTDADVNTDPAENEITTKLSKLTEKKQLTKEVAVKIAGEVDSYEDLVSYIEGTSLDKTGKVELEVATAQDDVEKINELIKGLPKEEQIGIVTAISNSGSLDPEQLKTLVEGLPKEVKSQIEVMAKNGELPQEICDALGIIPPKTDTEINVDDNGAKDGVDGVKTSFEDLDGTTATGVITVESEDEALQQTQGTLVELDGQQYLVVVNVDTGEKELVPFKQELNGLPTEKNISIGCTDNASGTLGIVASITIGNKTFSVSCSDLATSVVVGVINLLIPGKIFDINATDNASSKVGTVQGLKIGDKSFTISATDKASSVISTIKEKLRGIVSKTVDIVTNYITKGKSVSEPQIVEMESVGKPIVVDDFNNVVSTAQARIQDSATTFANAENDAIATIQANGFTDTILASSYWSGQAVDHNLDLLQDYMAQLDRLNSKLDITSAKIEGAFGTSKANLLKDQIKLLEQQQAMLKKQQKDAQTLANSYKSMLKKQGFKVDGNGAVTNATSKILELEHALEKAEKAQDSYNGKSESKQKSLAKSVENAQEKLNKAKDTLSEYYEYSSLVGETEAEWREIANAIADVKNEIYLANKEQALFYKEAKTTELEYSYDKLSDQLDILQSKMDLERNEGNIDLIKEEISLLKQMQIENEKVEASYRNQRHYYKNYLSGKGFSFDNGGNITNGADALNKNKASDELESIQDAYESYMQLQRDTIPDLEKDWWDLEKSIEDANDKIKEAEEELERLEKEMKELEKIKAFDFLDDLEHKQEQLEGTLSLLSAQMEHAFGYEKQQLIEQQIGLLEEQMSNINHINQGLKDQLSYLKQAMQSDGFTFDSKGNITNADTILALAQTQDEYDELKEKVEEYQDVQNQVTSNKTEWQNLQNEIIDTQKEIENLKYEIEDMRESAEIRELTNEFQVLQNQLDKLQAQQELNGADMVAIYEQQIEVIEEQKKAIDEQIDYQKKRANELANNLYEYGFKINDDGTINNTANQLEYLKDTLAEDEFERVNGYLEEYFDVALEEIPQLEQEMIGLNKAIQDIEEEKLNKAKEIEDEITEMLEKQIDERIEAIEEERDAQIDAISKAKDAYDKWRRDVDYEDDYNKQLEKVQELQAQLEIAKRDDSLSGQKRVADLMEQLKEEQENLEDLVQDRTDTVINDMFDSQIENVEDNAEAQIKNIENVFSETKIAEMVAEAMKTGIFEDIDGNIKSLDTALLDMANNSVEYMGVLGDGLKNELLDNLAVALDYMQQMEKVSINLSNIDYQSQRFAGVGYDKATVQGEIINNTTTDNSSRVVNVEFNPTIQIEGTTDLDETQLISILDRTKQDMIGEVQRQILSNMK